jgi:hypothetical protein
MHRRLRSSLLLLLLSGLPAPAQSAGNQPGPVSDGRILLPNGWALWLKEFREFERQGQMPRFQVMSLPGDHTLGTRPGRQTPRAMVAAFAAIP